MTESECFLKVEINPRIRQKVTAPCLLRKVPEIFCWTFIMRTSRSAKLLSKGTLQSCIKASTSFLCTDKRFSKFLALLCLTRPRFFTVWGCGGFNRASSESHLKD